METILKTNNQVHCKIVSPFNIIWDASNGKKLLNLFYLYLKHEMILYAIQNNFYYVTQKINNHRFIEINLFLIYL